MSFATCTQVSPACPVSATTYGYTPNIAANSALLLLFGLCCVVQLGLGIFHRTWTFLFALFVGCGMEFLGYIGRIQLHANPWNSGAYRLQITFLILAPSFVAAGIYLSVKHIILHLGSEYSLLRPKLFTWVFISCDAISFLVQGAGGGIAGSSGTNIQLLNTGNNLMVAGIAFQVVTMSVCGLLAAHFASRVYRSLAVARELSASPTTTFSASPAKFKMFCLAVVFSYVVVLIRCIYRIPEMAGGWGNPLMRNESEFLVLDGLMMVFAAITFTVFHPGVWFSSMSGRSKIRTGRKDEDDSREMQTF